MSEPKFHVFVFGTLKQGFPNFHLNHGERLEGDFKTREAYLFYLVGERYSPCIYTDSGKGEPITGEVYQVNQTQLDTMDVLERVGDANGYTRQLVSIIDNKTRRIIDAFIYLKTANQINPEAIKLGPITDYKKEQADLYRPLN